MVLEVPVLSQAEINIKNLMPKGMQRVNHD